jgi:hypothetical protein
MTQFSSLFAKAVVEAIFPKNAKNFLFWPRMKRNLRQMQFNDSVIQELEQTVEECAFEVMVEQYGEISYESGGKTYNCIDVKYERDDQSPSGFTATNEDARIRIKQQDFINILDFQSRIREKFIAALNRNNQNNAKESTAEPLPASLAAVKRPRLFLIRKEELATPAANM